MQEHELPTWTEIVDKTLASLDVSRAGLSEARDWLASDWRPLDSAISEEAADARVQLHKLISQAKSLIDEAKEQAHRAQT